MAIIPWRQWLWLVPALALGLFAGRIFSEQLRPGLLGAILLTLLAIGLSGWGLRRRPVRQTWPALLLFLYILYPDPNPAVALRTAGLAFLVFLFEEVNARTQRRKENGTQIFADERRLMILVGGLLAAGFLVLYVATLAPDLLPADNGEFQLVATQLGVAHPPGFPLYTMLGYVVTHLPVGSTPAYRLNLLSAVTSAATLFLVYLTCYRLTKSKLAGVAAVLALGTATTFWAQATTANIRSLTAFFAALAIYLLISYCVLRIPYSEGSNTQYAIRNTSPPLSPLHLVTLSLIFTLGLTHHASLVFMFLVCGLFLLLVEPGLLWMPRRWPAVIAGVLVGLLPLLYLPWRAAAGARGAPADLLTLSGFLNHVLALGFRGDFFAFSEPAVLWQRLLIMGNVLTFQFEPLLLVGMLAGLLVLLRYDRKVALLLGGSFAIHTLITATYRAPQTVEYMMPAYVPAVLCLGYGVGKAYSVLRIAYSEGDHTQYAIRNTFASVLTAVVLLVAIQQGIERLPSYVELHQDRAAREYVRPILEEAPAGSVVLADWHWVTPLWYLQEVEGQRPDLAIRYVFPTGEPYATTWARRISEELGSGRSVIATHFDPATYASLPPYEPIGEAFLFSQEARQEMPAGFLERRIELGGAIYVVGYRLEPEQVEIGREMVLTLAWQPIANLQSPISLFAHLVGPDNALYAQQDLPAQAQPEGLTLTQFRLTPRPGAMPGSFRILIGAYGSEPLLDEAGRIRAPLRKVLVLPATRPPYTQNATYRPAADGSRQLIGYDWDMTLAGRSRLYLHWQAAGGYYTEVLDNPATLTLPPTIGPWGISRKSQIPNPKSQISNYVPLGQGIVWLGRPISNLQSPISNQSFALWQEFGSSRPVLRDLVVSVRLVGFEEDGVHWGWWDLNDGVPAMGAIPTLKWIAGSRVYDPHGVTMDAAAHPGQTIGGLLVVYDAFTNRPLAILDEGISQQAMWIPLGTNVVRQPGPTSP